LVRPLDRHAPQQVGIDPMPPSRQTQSGLGIDRLQAHQPHQALHPLAVDWLPLLDQPGGHPPTAVEGTGGVLLVDEPHQPQVLGRLAGRLVVEARPAPPPPPPPPPHPPPPRPPPPPPTP